MIIPAGFWLRSVATALDFILFSTVVIGAAPKDAAVDRIHGDGSIRPSLSGCQRRPLPGVPDESFPFRSPRAGWLPETEPESERPPRSNTDEPRPDEDSCRNIGRRS